MTLLLACTLTCGCATDYVWLRRSSEQPADGSKVLMVAHTTTSGDGYALELRVDVGSVVTDGRSPAAVICISVPESGSLPFAVVGASDGSVVTATLLSESGEGSEDCTGTVQSMTSVPVESSSLSEGGANQADATGTGAGTATGTGTGAGGGGENGGAPSSAGTTTATTGAGGSAP